MIARRALIASLAIVALTACARTKAPANEAEQGKAFLAKNAAAPGVHVTASGLQYRVLASGPTTGLRPKIGDEVKVNYEGKLLDGQIFDSSFQRGAPAVMTLRDLVPGWMEALPLMRPGDEWLIYLPAKLGYGDKGVGPIPPGAVLVFRLQLIGVLPSDASIGRA